MSGRDLLFHVARLASTLRERAIAVRLGDEIDAVRALTLVDVGDPAEVRVALRAALRIIRSEWTAFDQVFDAWWRFSPAAPTAAPPGGAPPPVQGGRFPVWDAERARLAETPAADRPAGELPGYSPHAIGRRKRLDEPVARERRAMERVVAALARRLATRRSRRWVPSPTGDRLDLRHSFRRAVRTEGDLVALARRTRAEEEPRLVFVVDTSGSMEAHTRFLLAFVLALRGVAPRTEVFAFNTGLVRLTPWLGSRRFRARLDRVAEQVPDWSGGTRIGESLAALVERHRSVLGSRAVVVILSDGLDRGAPALLTRAMRHIRTRARRILWLNPLLADPRYEPTTAGMQAALPFVDHFAPAHDLPSLERLARALAA